MEKLSTMKKVSTTYNRLIEVWRNVKVTNELLESDTEPVKIKSIWVKIIPQTGKIQTAQIDTKFSTVTSKIVTRYNAAKDILESDFLIYKGKRFDIKFILDPYETNEILELFCEQKSR